MPAGGLLALLDDITAVLDDVSVMTKVAATKTAGVLGDDLALNAQQVAGVRADRELPVIWAVAKGSAINKAILVPGALAISAFAPWAVTPLLMAGGAYLCFEGVEKLAHKAPQSDQPPTVTEACLHASADADVFERAKIKDAIRTDFVLSAEIVVITLGTVAGETLSKQVAVLIAIAAIMTVGVYGLVAGIVRLDDVGRFLDRRRGSNLSVRLMRGTGRSLLIGTPYLMRCLSFVGTAAMFLVGGSILVHGIPGAHDAIHRFLGEAVAISAAGAAVAWFAPLLANAALGMMAGAVTYGAVRLARHV
jgi:hypothetical protein